MRLNEMKMYHCLCPSTGLAVLDIRINVQLILLNIKLYKRVNRNKSLWSKIHPKSGLSRLSITSNYSSFRQLCWNRLPYWKNTNSSRLPSALQLNIGMSLVHLLSICFWMHLVPELPNNWRVLWRLCLRRKTLHWWNNTINNCWTYSIINNNSHLHYYRGGAKRLVF